MAVTNGPETPTKRLCHVLLAMYYIISKGISKHNWFSLDLHLLFKRGRLAAKSLKQLTNNSSPTRHAKDYISVLTCRSMDTSMVYVPREVEFSCSNTPSFPSLYNKKQKLFRGNNHGGCRNDCEVLNKTRIFELLDMEEYYSDEEDEVSVVDQSPSPWIGWKTPVGVRPLRVTDSPFLSQEIMEVNEREEGFGGGVDIKAEEFITWFREQLREQQLSSSLNMEKRRYLK
ncbi:hypothetical protein LUZ60_008395 [Juncus effusus]|nr:hypothetical protein LUZ60_008395 [Juncus effusus]